MFTITRNGLDAISKDLGVISNNIANAGTNGFPLSTSFDRSTVFACTPGELAEKRLRGTPGGACVL